MQIAAINHVARQRLGLSIYEYLVADFVYHHQPDIDDIVAYIDIPKQDIQVILDRLVQLGLIYTQDEQYLISHKWYENVVKKGYTYQDITVYPYKGNSFASQILDILKSYNNGVLDGTKDENMRYARLLFRKLHEIDLVQSGVMGACECLDCILQAACQETDLYKLLISAKSVYIHLGTLIANTRKCKIFYDKPPTKCFRTAKR